MKKNYNIVYDIRRQYPSTISGVDAQFMSSSMISAAIGRNCVDTLVADDVTSSLVTTIGVVVVIVATPAAAAAAAAFAFALSSAI